MRYIKFRTSERGIWHILDEGSEKIRCAYRAGSNLRNASIHNEGAVIRSEPEEWEKVCSQCRTTPRDPEILGEIFKAKERNFIVDRLAQPPRRPRF